VNFDSRAIELAISFAGAEHILAGSDYPHKIGSIPKMLESIRALNISDADKVRVLGGNAENLVIR
jgi:aminocarboxymuconate-semialdehyde decarboxylase